jgi:hypothetical protein
VEGATMRKLVIAVMQSRRRITEWRQLMGKFARLLSGKSEALDRLPGDGCLKRITGTEFLPLSNPPL